MSKILLKIFQIRNAYLQGVQRRPYFIRNYFVEVGNGFSQNVLSTKNIEIEIVLTYFDVNSLCLNRICYYFTFMFGFDYEINNEIC